MKRRRPLEIDFAAYERRLEAYIKAHPELYQALESVQPGTNYYWGPWTPGATPVVQAAGRKRTRKVPANMWHWSAAEPTLRRRILSLPYLGQDEIDPDKPYLVSEEAGTVSIVQEVE